MDQDTDCCAHTGPTWARGHIPYRTQQDHPPTDASGRSDPHPRTRGFIVKDFGGGANYHVEGFWKEEGDSADSTTSLWEGRAILYDIGSYPSVYEHDVKDGSRVPDQAHTPKDRTMDERELHNLTHLPYRSWCQTCLHAKARNSYHKQLQADDGFLTDTDIKQNIQVLPWIDVATSLASSCMVPQMRFGDDPLTELRRLMELG